MAIITCFQNVPATWQEYWKIMVRHGFLILWGKKKIGEGRVHQRSGEMKRSLRTTAWHCSSFSYSISDILGGLQKENKIYKK